MVRRGVCLVLAACAAFCAPALAASPRIAGGSTTTVDSAPYAALVTDGAGNCTGAIISPTVVWTAARCVTGDDHAAKAASAISVVAGVSSSAEAGGQTATVAAVRVHPRWTSRVDDTDDVAALTLATPLVFGPKVGSIAIGVEPAAGARVRLYGFGTQTPTSGDGHLRALEQTVVAPAGCEDNATTLCAHGDSGSGCRGDTGGPLVTTDGPATLVGLESRGDDACTAADDDLYAKVTAPELRAFLTTGDASLVAPRHPRNDAAYSVLPIEGQTMTCHPGSFDGAPSYSASFLDAATGQVLQTGPSLSYTFRHTDVGRTVTCAIVATNAGGSYHVALLPATPPLTALRDPGLRITVGTKRSYAITVHTDAKTLTLATADAQKKFVRTTTFPAGTRPLHKKLKGGSYRTCVISPQTVLYAGGLACVTEVVPGTASDLVHATMRRTGHRFRVALGAVTPAVGRHVTVSFRVDGKPVARHAVKLSKRKVLTSPTVKRGHKLTLAVPLPRLRAAGVPYSKSTAVLKIGTGR